MSNTWPRRASRCTLLAGLALLAGGGACCGGKPPAPAAGVTAAPGAPAATSAPAAELRSPPVGAPASAGAFAHADTPRPPSPSPTPVRLDPCALVTRAEAEAVLGGAAAAPLVQRTSLLAQCQYSLAGTATPAATRAAVVIQIFPPGPTNWQLRKDAFAQSKPVQSVTGVGEDAFWVEAEAALFVLDKGVVFDIRVLGQSPAAALAAATALGRKAAGRL